MSFSKDVKTFCYRKRGTSQIGSNWNYLYSTLAQKYEVTVKIKYRKPRGRLDVQERNTEIYLPTKPLCKDNLPVKCTKLEDVKKLCKYLEQEFQASMASLRTGNDGGN